MVADTALDTLRFDKIHIKNFRSHKDTIIDYDEDFTAIMGPTDSGKSATLGAVTWVLYNEPSGDKFIRQEYEMDSDGEVILDEDGKKISKDLLTCDCELFFNNGKSIRHVKSSKIHYYELKINDEVILRLENFGVGPVKEVCDFHGMYKVDFFKKKESLNICGQMEEPFFLSQTPSARATLISRMANVDVVDLAIKNTETEIKSSKKEVKKKKGELKDVNENLKTVKNLPKMEKDLDKLSNYINKVSELETKMKLINEKVIDLEALNIQKDNLEKILSQTDKITNLIDIVSGLSELMIKYNTISKVNKLMLANIARKDSLGNIVDNIDTDKLDGIVSDMENSKALIKKKDAISKADLKLKQDRIKLLDIKRLVDNNIDVDKVFLHLNKCEKDLNKIEEITDISQRLEHENFRKRRGEEVMNKLDLSYNEKIQQYKGVLRKYKICPTCFNDITEDKIDKIKDI